MTITTTEEVENLARMWDWWEAGQAADALRSLAAERDASQAKAFRVAVAYEALKAENEKLREALREIRNKARTGRPPFMSSKTDFFQIASKALGEKE